MTNRWALTLAALLLVLPSVGAAQGAAQGAAASGQGWACWAEASRQYGIPVTLLYSIARVESSSNARTVHTNPNGSRDIGLMQINSWWLPKLKAYGITEQALLDDACLNLKVGAWILANSIHDHGLNWRGVGAYNARTDSKRMKYASRVAREVRRVRHEGYSSGAFAAAAAAHAETETAR